MSPDLAAQVRALLSSLTHEQSVQLLSILTAAASEAFAHGQKSK